MKKNIENLAVYYLAKRMHTVDELRKKLLKKYPEGGEDVEDILASFIERKILDDEDFVRCYLEFELRTNFRGKFGYWQKLMKKGVEKSLFESIWEELSPNEEDLAKKLLENNSFRFENEADKQKKRVKIQRYLAGRGFGFDVIQKLTKE